MKKILIIDDDVTMRMLITAVLRGSYTILEAGSGAEGIVQAREGVPDLVIVDMIMPGMNGLEVCRELKGDPATRSVQILMMTARDGQKDLEAALEAGADYFLAKPFKPAELIVRMGEILAGG